MTRLLKIETCYYDPEGKSESLLNKQTNQM